MAQFKAVEGDSISWCHLTTRCLHAFNCYYMFDQNLYTVSKVF